jgi:hypothetical protein
MASKFPTVAICSPWTDTQTGGHEGGEQTHRSVERRAYPVTVLLTYLDESYNAKFYLIAALLVPDSEARGLTSALDDVVEDAAFNYRKIKSNSELHGQQIFNGKGEWASLATNIEARITVYSDALQAIADHDVTIIIRSLDIARLDTRYGPKHDEPHSIVLTHIIELVNEYAKASRENTIMIADEVPGQDSYRRDLSQYQRSSTWGYKAQQITQVVDTIHFAPSAASRLVQAADLIAFMARRTSFHVENDKRAKAAIDGMWDRIQPKIHHQQCWYP